MSAGTIELLSGWGRYPRHASVVRRYESLAALRTAVTSPDGKGCIARGLGRSYGDSALLPGGTVLVQTERDRLLAFDDSTGIVQCEAGVSLKEIIEVFLPRGWFLPTTPGTKFVTIGGAIAADIHGKNHHVDGSFGEWVRGLTLLLPSGETVECSPESHAEIFWATVGGMGLTGIILDARVQLRRTTSAYCIQTLRRTQDLDSTLRYLQEHDHDYRYSVAWVDCLAKGRRLGRSVVMLANDAGEEDLPKALRSSPLLWSGKRSVSVPFSPPMSLIGPWSARAFNGLYYRAHGDSEGLVDYAKFFYPLDGIEHWNRIYGPRGFIQYQALFPLATASEGIRALLEQVAKAGVASFLGVLKRSGAAGRGHLSFLYPGYTLALDLPHPGSRLPELCSALDDIVLRHGGRVYLAKDAVTSREAFVAMYPELNAFRAVKAKVDPEQRFRSAQSSRLGITDQ